MKTNYRLHTLFFLFAFIILSSFGIAQTVTEIQANYTKYEYRIPMRDGATLFTSVYVPKDTTQTFPIMLNRTPYTVAPYGDGYKTSIGPSVSMMKEKYIFAYQDVRGKFMSDGEYVDVRPHIPQKKSNNDVDESSDTFDTIDWLVKNVPRNNGTVGMWGISYPGFYAAHGLINAHPALKAVSPQAPIGDWFMGDDFHHNGAFFLIDGFNFYRSFGKPRPKLTTTWPPGFEYPTPDAYRFLLEGGSLASLKKNYYGDTVQFWNELFKHPTYDEFWKARSVPQHLKKITPAVMTVGGLFDAEDLYGPLHMYDAIEKQNPKTYNILVLGPWYHGGWARGEGDYFGNIRFGEKTSVFYQEHIELPFFNYYLKGKGELHLPDAYVFETGSNEWKQYETWPPKNIERKKIYFQANGKLSMNAPTENDAAAYDEYISNPNRPVPYIADIRNNRTREYMIDDQRFVWQRPDVLSYETDPLEHSVTTAGPITANLFVSTTGTDADFIVKIIDVFPDSTKETSPNADVKMGGFQMLVLAEVMRARFRTSFEKPTAMKPNEITNVKFQLQDVNHCFKRGHKIMVQVQSSWFPLVDRNPQKFVNLYEAKESDFQKATHRIYRNANSSSCIEMGVLH